MQPPTYREIVARLRREGFELVGQSGSHARYAKGSLKVTVSGNGGDRPKKSTWSSIRRQAGW